MTLKLRPPPPPVAVTALRLASSFNPSVSLNRLTAVNFPPLQSSFFGNGVGVTCVQMTYSNKLRCNCVGGDSFGSNINFFGRLGRIFRLYASSILIYIKGPDWIIEQAINDMTDDMKQMRKAVKQVSASQEQLDSKLESAKQAAIEWNNKAQLAFIKGDKQFAREALQLRNAFLEDVETLKTQNDLLKRVVENLNYKIRLLENKIREANAKREAFLAIDATTKTVTRVQSLIRNLYGRSAVSVVEMIEEKLLTLEYEAESLHHMTANNLEEKFALLEGSSANGDSEELKNELFLDSRGRASSGKTEVLTDESVSIPS